MYYECINSPFILYKTYLELLCRVIYNTDKKILAGFLSEIKGDCGNLSFCNQKTCIATKKNKVSFIVLKETTNFCLQIMNICVKYIDADFITQFKIEFLLLFTGCRKVLGKMPDGIF